MVGGYPTLVRTWNFHSKLGIDWCSFIDLHCSLLISNTIRITIISRSREIKIMRLVGAKNGYIRAPFLFEGAWIGLLGALVPSALVFYVYNVVYTSMNNNLADQNLYLYSPHVLVPIMVGGLFGLGILIGAIGSSISMRRFLKI